MTIRIEVTGETPAQIAVALQELAKLYGGAQPQPPLVVVEIPAEAPAAVEPAPAAKKTRTKKEAAVEAPASAPTPEPAEVQAQDAADEQAEVDANRNQAAPLTREDVKKAMTAYVAAYGLDVTQKDGPVIFKEALGEPPAGEKYWKLSLVPDEQETLARVIDTWARATKQNPLKREKVA